MSWVPVQPSGSSMTVLPNRTYRVVVALKGDKATDSAITKYLAGNGWSNIVLWDDTAPLPPDWPDKRTSNSEGWRHLYGQATRTGPQGSLSTNPTDLGLLKRLALSALGVDFQVLSGFYDDGNAPVPPPHPISPNLPPDGPPAVSIPKSNVPPAPGPTTPSGVPYVGPTLVPTINLPPMPMQAGTPPRITRTQEAGLGATLLLAFGAIAVGKIADPDRGGKK